MKTLFWILLFGTFYSYLGYPLLLFVLIRLKRFFQRKKRVQCFPIVYEPEVSLIVPAYNEREVIDQKMANTLALDYPMERLHVIWVTDGSTDGSDQYLMERYAKVISTPSITVLHQSERRGKSAALNRAVFHATTDIVICCDANTMLNEEAIRKIVHHFQDPTVGGVAGEKRVLFTDSTVSTGESLYWKFESWLKKLNSEFHTCIGAVGELNAFRRELYEPLPEDTIIDDFVISMRIAEKGYRVIYEPAAYTEELPSENEKEEMKRKIRIAAGDFQTLFRYPQWLSPLKNPLLAFQYLSYKVSRWVFVPLALPLLLISNIWLLIQAPSNPLWQFFALIQLLFYGSALLFHLFRFPSKFLRLLYYFLLMNISFYGGFFRYLRGTQSAVWEKAKRVTSTASV